MTFSAKSIACATAITFMLGGCSYGHKVTMRLSDGSQVVYETETEGGPFGQEVCERSVLFGLIKWNCRYEAPRTRTTIIRFDPNGKIVEVGVFYPGEEEELSKGTTQSAVATGKYTINKH